MCRVKQTARFATTNVRWKASKGEAVVPHCRLERYGKAWLIGGSGDPGSGALQIAACQSRGESKPR